MSEIWNLVEKKRRRSNSSTETSSPSGRSPATKRPFFPERTPPGQVHVNKNTGKRPQMHVDTISEGENGEQECDEHADSEQMLTYIVKSMKGLRHDTTLIRSKVSYIEEYLESMESKLDNCISAIEVLFEQQSEGSKAQASLVDSMTKLKTDTDTRLKTMEDKFTQQEDQSRRNNLIFYGILEGENDTWQKHENDVRVFMKTKMDIADADDSDKLVIERAYRIGRKTPGNTRPILARFLNWRRKSEVFVKARDIPRDSTVRIGEDFNRRVREIRKHLYPKLQEARQQGKRASLRYDKLHIENNVYTVNQQNTIVPTR